MTTLQYAFEEFTCDKMDRAWRNRSPITMSHWQKLSISCYGDENRASALYVACGHFCRKDGVFSATSLTPENWASIVELTDRYYQVLPEKGLSHWGWAHEHNRL